MSRWEELAYASDMRMPIYVIKMSRKVIGEVWGRRVAQGGETWVTMLYPVQLVPQNDTHGCVVLHPPRPPGLKKSVEALLGTKQACTAACSFCTDTSPHILGATLLYRVNVSWCCLLSCPACLLTTFQVEVAVVWALLHTLQGSMWDAPMPEDDPDGVSLSVPERALSDIIHIVKVEEAKVSRRLRGWCRVCDSA